MAALIKKLVRRGGGGAAAPGGPPAVFVGAFGKHPAWHDHILPAIGLEGRLTGVMETLYFGGVQKSIAAWREASAGDLIPFGHLFAWRTPADVVLGRLWHSHDGAKPPRSDYPMVVCVQCVNVSRAWALGYVPEALERLERDCKAATTRQGVEDVINAARDDLRRAARPEATAADADSGERAVARLADDERVGAEGLARVTYVLHEASEAHPRQARVPRVGNSEADGLRTWADFMEARFGDGEQQGLTRVLVAAAGEEWVDLILGAPDWSHFRALRYSTAVVAPDTRTPYSLDVGFVRASGEFVARCRTTAASTPVPTEAIPPPPVMSSAGQNVDLPVSGSAAGAPGSPPALLPIPGVAPLEDGDADGADGAPEAAAVTAAGGRAWKWVAIWVVLGALLLLGVAVLVLVSRAEHAAGARG